MATNPHVTFIFISVGFCGVKDVVFGDINKFNAKPPFRSQEERIKKLEETDTWRKSAAEGNIAPFDSMRVGEN